MKFGLNQKLMTVGTLALLIMAAILWFSNRGITQLSTDITLSKEMSNMQQLVNLMQEQSTQYKQNAPRDYESYNRDLKVFFTQLQDNLSTLKTQVESVAHQFYNRSSTTDLLLDGMLIEKNSQSFIAMEQASEIFDRGFREQIGDNPDEPRLEWGNDYILNDTSGLFSSISSAHLNFEALVEAQRKATVKFNWLAIGLIGLVMLLLFFWFNQTIVKRVIRVAKACREVALGNYGLRINDNSQDELGQLVEDFNHLSGRSKSILNLLNQLHIAPSKQQALEVIRQESRAIVNVSGVYLLLPNKESFACSLIASDQPQEELVGKSLLSNDTTIENILSKEYVLLSDLLSHTVSNKQAHFSKYLLNQTHAHSVLSLPIKSHNKSGVIVFTRNSKQGFQETQIQSLVSLSPLFAKALL
ncbi:HAMP domain-containing protein [Marinicella sp. S1101]|nr:HAMP domain-containing protein [Marinicella marina]MCX7553207.1 HAMP domain-containing protein [Marinicella marina]